jgi:hypothetical protein
VTAIVRSLPQDDVDEQARRREAYARMRSHLPAVVAHRTADDRSPRFATVALLWAVALLAVVGWLVVTFAARLSQLAAAAAGVVEKR